MQKFIANILNRFDKKYYGKYLQLINVLALLGIRVDRNGKIIEILDMDYEASSGRMWHNMTPDQQDECRKVWRKKICKSE